jgi:hypothetical protein
MKKNKLAAIALVLLFAVPFGATAQKDSAKNELVVNLAYYMNNNNIIYLIANTKTKIDGKFRPVQGINLNLFLDADSAGNLISKLTTDKNGLAKTVLPPALKTVWDGSPKHNFIAVSEPTKGFESVTAETAITKSKITIDTVAGGETRTISVIVSSFSGTEWVPVKDVEMKVGVSRSGGGILSADEQTYTTDSSGTVTAEFKLDSLPGDLKGNIVLVAKVDENEQLGNLLVEKVVPWGVVVNPSKGFFDQRTLWSTRFRTPFWLLFMAYSIVIGVWGTIFYLVRQIIKINKLGAAS